MATLELDVSKTAEYDGFSKATGASITNDVNVTWDDQLTENELVDTLGRIIDSIVGKNKVTW